MKMQSILQAVTLSFAALLTACGGGGSSTNSSGTVSASLTDAPACGYDHVYVTVNKLRINASANAGPSDAGWYDITLSSPRKIDLLNLTNGALESLGSRPLPEGTYQQLRLVLSPNASGSSSFANSVVPSNSSTGAEVALSTPSSVQTGIKVIHPFTVQPDTLVDLVLDFNACKSVVKTGSTNGHGPVGYILKPVVTAATKVVSGQIDGYVTDAALTDQSGTHVFAEQNGHIIRGTITDSSGHFILYPLEQSSSAGNYDIVITKIGDSSGYATEIVQGVPVVAQSRTSVSTAAAPFALIASSVATVTGNVGSPTTTNASLEALQTIAAASYQIATTNADASTGFYSLALPRGAPLVGSYSSSLPITLSPSVATAGQYKIRATSSSGNTASQNVDVSASSSAQADFMSLQ